MADSVIEYFDECFKHLKETIEDAVKRTFSNDVENLIRYCQSFQETGKINEEDASAIASYVTEVVLLNPTVANEINSFTGQFFREDETRRLIANKLKELVNDCYDSVRTDIVPRAEMYGKLDAIKKEYGFLK